jgi:uncharacterized membrane protein HdeD (DUF308 family)
MKRTQFKAITLTPMRRFFLFAFGLLMLAFGILTIIGSLEEPTYWRGARFGPFALLIGGLAIVTALSRRSN